MFVNREMQAVKYRLQVQVCTCAYPYSTRLLHISPSFVLSEAFCESGGTCFAPNEGGGMDPAMHTPPAVDLISACLCISGP